MNPHTSGQHKINYPNIGMILLLGTVAISIGMSHQVEIKLPSFNAAPVIASGATTFQNSIGSIASTGIIIGVIIFVSIAMYGLVGLGGLGGRR